MARTRSLPIRLQKNRSGETPKEWDDLDIVISLPHGWDWQDLKMRNLTWIENGNQGDSAR